MTDYILFTFLQSLQWPVIIATSILKSATTNEPRPVPGATESKWHVWLLRETDSLWPEVPRAIMFMKWHLSDFWWTLEGQLAGDTILPHRRCLWTSLPLTQNLLNTDLFSWSFLTFCFIGEFTSVFNRIKYRVTNRTWTWRQTDLGLSSDFLSWVNFILTSLSSNFFVSKMGIIN